MAENIFKTSWKNYGVFRLHDKFCCNILSMFYRASVTKVGRSKLALSPRKNERGSIVKSRRMFEF